MYTEPKLLINIYQFFVLNKLFMQCYFLISFFKKKLKKNIFFFCEKIKQIGISLLNISKIFKI